MFLRSVIKAFSIAPTEVTTLQTKILLAVFFLGMAAVVFYNFFKFFEEIYSLKNNKPFFVFGHIFKRKLNPVQLKVLESEFLFYKKLSKKHKRYFEHRVASFIRNKSFLGRQDLNITEQMKVLVAATAVMLTFGFRKYLIDGIDQVLIYPDEYYSKINEEYHKGEFNPRLNTLVLSWKHFIEGYDISNDNLNLGIHEITHAIHLNSLKETDISAFNFKNNFLDITDYLSENAHIRKKLIDNNYIREYAFANQFEFVAVIIETFIETPKEFKSQFPEIYKLVKRMLNFNFAGY